MIDLTTRQRHRRPTRTCVGCGARGHQDTLLRISADLKTSEGKRGVGGRSAYVHEDATCVDRIFTRRLLRRSLRRDITVAQRETLIKSLEKSLQERIGA